ncbi:hypothetical protein AVEN_123840-1, partial [Araneus ventricosus]
MTLGKNVNITLPFFTHGRSSVESGSEPGALQSRGRTLAEGNAAPKVSFGEYQKKEI